MKELWSGRSRAADPDSSPPLILEINICISQAKRRFLLGTAKIVTRG